MEPKGLGFPVFVGQWGSVYDVGHEAEEQVFKKKKKTEFCFSWYCFQGPMWFKEICPVVDMARCSYLLSVFLFFDRNRTQIYIRINDSTE